MIATASTSLAPDYTAAMYVDNKGADFISDETADRRPERLRQDAQLHHGAVLRSLDKVACAQAGMRNLLTPPSIRQLATSPAVRAAIEPILGKAAFAVRGILFNKLPAANWKVPWHQDCVISVKQRRDAPGRGPWSVKDGIDHVRPSADIMERMVALRIHLDDCCEENGPLRVIRGSHHHGILKEEQILGWPKDNAVTCTAERGDIILMRPLLLHASSAATVPTDRRVI